MRAAGRETHNEHASACDIVLGLASHCGNLILDLLVFIRYKAYSV